MEKFKLNTSLLNPTDTEPNSVKLKYERQYFPIISANGQVYNWLDKEVKITPEIKVHKVVQIKKNGKKKHRTLHEPISLILEKDGNSAVIDYKEFLRACAAQMFSFKKELRLSYYIGDLKYRGVMYSINDLWTYKYICHVDVKDYFPKSYVPKIPVANICQNEDGSFSVDRNGHQSKRTGWFVPMGFPTSSLACGIHNSIAVDTIVGCLRKRNIGCALYVDDFIIGTNNIEDAKYAFEVIKGIMGEQGYELHKHRIAGPGAKQVFLGATVAFQMMPRVGYKKRKWLRAVVHNLKRDILNGEPVSYKRVQKVLGYLSWAISLEDQKEELFKQQMREIRHLFGMGRARRRSA